MVASVVINAGCCPSIKTSAVVATYYLPSQLAKRYRIEPALSRLLLSGVSLMIVIPYQLA